MFAKPALDVINSIEDSRFGDVFWQYGNEKLQLALADQLQLPRSKLVATTKPGPVVCWHGNGATAWAAGAVAPGGLL